MTEDPAELYRENHERAIYLHGQIGQELVDKITPDINRLRLTSSKPITVYIDCPGGDIFAADTIRELIKCPNPDGSKCQLLTVATGTAASAAADFLVMGDYAIAHGHTFIMYHGTREQRRQALTFEAARSLVSSLQETNEMFARRLAQRVFKRFALRLCQLTAEFDAYRDTDGDDSLAISKPLITALRKKISPGNHKLIRDAVQKQEGIIELTRCVQKSLKRKKITGYSQAKLEATLLTAILDHKVRLHTKAKDRWQLSGRGLSEITDDFSLLHDFYFGHQNRDLAAHIQTLGQLFLRDQWRADFKKLNETPENTVKWLTQHAIPKMQPIWYFLVSLCRILQTADYLLSPEDGYWLGMIDEIPGSALPNLRQASQKTKADEAAAI